MKTLYVCLERLANYPARMVPDWIVMLTVRLALFLVFWLSAQTKISGLTIPAITIGEFTLMSAQHLAFWSVTDSTIMLFEYEYELPLLPPMLAAYLATMSEFIFSLFILFGFMARLSAIAFLIMTVVIQFFVYPDAWAVHLLWTGGLLTLIKRGAGPLSIDGFISRKASGKKEPAMWQ